MKNNRKKILSEIIKKNQDAILVKNKYKVLAGMIKRMYPKNFEKISDHMWEQIIFDITNGNRDWQMLTEGFDKENKEILSQQWKISNGYMKDITPKRLIN